MTILVIVLTNGKSIDFHLQYQICDIYLTVLLATVQLMSMMLIPSSTEKIVFLLMNLISSFFQRMRCIVATSDRLAVTVDRLSRINLVPWYKLIVE